VFHNICSKCLEESHTVVLNCHTPSFDGVFSPGADAILFKYVNTSVKEGAPECSSTCAYLPDVRWGPTPQGHPLLSFNSAFLVCQVEAAS